MKSKTLILEPTETSQWQKLVKDAERDYGKALDESMQSYLVFTLMRFSTDPALNTKALAPDFLEAQCLPQIRSNEQLRDIGDQCLLVAGLYPHSAERRQVGVNYYIDMGRSAYHHVSTHTQRSIAELYHSLALHFTFLMDLLQTIRQYSMTDGTPVLQPISAYDVWLKQGNHGALNQISESGTPVWSPEAYNSDKKH